MRTLAFAPPEECRPETPETPETPKAVHAAFALGAGASATFEDVVHWTQRLADTGSAPDDVVRSRRRHWVGGGLPRGAASR